jgi:hypothetical protein
MPRATSLAAAVTATALIAPAAADAAWTTPAELPDLHGGGRGRVYASHRPPGGAFGPPRALTRARATYAPQVAMNADGRAVITWRANRRTEAVSVADGRFGRVTVVAKPQLDGRPTVAVAEDGSAVIAWSEQRFGPPWRRTGAVWRGLRGRFGRPRILGTSPPPWSADWPAVAAGPAGETVVTWREARGARGRLLAVRGPRGSVQTVRPFGMGRAGSPDAAFGPDGRLTIVWQEGRRSGTPVVRAATAGRRGTFGAPETVGPSEPASFATASVAPAVASGGHTTLAVWTLPSNGIRPARVRWSALRQP